MHAALKDVPIFDAADFRGRTADWKKLLDSAPVGRKRTVIEWGVGRGPNCFVYPAPRRALGVHLAQGGTQTGSDERWADFLEFEFVPQIVAALKEDGLFPQAICVDQRPIQIMRQRRREQEAFARSRAGEAAHH